MSRSIWIAAVVLLGLLGPLAACGDNRAVPGPSDLLLSPHDLQLRVGDTGRVTARYLAVGEDLAASDVAWSSSDPSLAAVRGGAEATITAIAPGAVTITAAGRGLSATVEVSISPAELLRIEVAPAQPSVAAGRTIQLTATATYSDGTTADVTAAALWASDREGVATVFAGLVHGRTQGNATITARLSGKLSAGAMVAVEPPVLESIAVTPDSPLVPLGTPQAFTATGTFSDASTADLTDQVTWTLSNPAVASISNAPGSAGHATTVGTGTAMITASLGPISGTAQLMVSSAALQSIAITPSAPDVALSADHPFTATGTFSDQSTADLTEQVAWSSSNALVATISNTTGTRGLADAVGTGTTTITASLGAISGTTQMNVFLAPVGAWVPEPGVPAVRACVDGVKFSMASDLVYVCTADSGVMKGTVTGTSIAWSSANVGITNLQGQAIAAHATAVNTMMYLAAPQPGVANWFRSQDGAATFSPYSLLDSAGNPRALYSGRFQPMVGNLLGSWDPGSGGAPQAVILIGSNPPTNVRVLGASGTVRSITGSSATNLYAGVLGETPAGAPATGGIFRSTNNAVTWTAQDSGIPAADKDRVFSLAIDPVDPAILYAGLLGGGRVYKTIDGGASWTASASGLPAKARVSQLLISPQSPSTIFAATQIGLYRSDDAGATWALAGFQGRRIRAVAQSGATAALILVAVDDEVGLYRAL